MRPRRQPDSDGGCRAGREFVGIDLSGRQIDDAHAVASKLGLSNIDLKHASILDVDASYGEFDYIICHGVYAWVPREVQDKILSIYAEHLTPDGVGHVSYNTYPGWHFRGMVRDMLVYHSSGSPIRRHGSQPPRPCSDFLARVGRAGVALRPDPQRRTRSAREAARLLPVPRAPRAGQRPLYFHEFAERAAAADLQYLGDADPPTMGHFNFPEDVQQILRTLSNNVVQAEQYMDFLRNRMFRQSLLVKPNVQHSRSLTPASLRGLASPVRRSSTGRRTAPSSSSEVGRTRR